MDAMRTPAKEALRITFHVGGSLVLAALARAGRMEAADRLARRLRVIDLRLR